MYIIRLTSNDYEEGMALLRLAFGNADFPHLLPKIYDCDEGKMSCNLAIKQDGKIRAIVGLFPMEVEICGKLFKVGGIGGVSAHPDNRGSGYMTILMNAAVSEMKEQGYHFSVLGGLRQRYSYYGYEPCGLRYEYTVLKYNVSHTFKNLDSNKISFIKISNEDKEYMDFVQKLYNSKVVHLNRSSREFYNFLISWNNVPYVAIDDAGKMLGYFCTNLENTYISEINAVSADSFAKMVASWVAFGTDKGSVTFDIPPWETEYHRELNKFSNHISIKENYNFNIFDWESVIASFLLLKQSIDGLCDGSLILGINGYGNLEISVKNGISSCLKTNGVAEIELTSNTAKQLIFGPASPALICEIPACKINLFSSWFPLPLAWIKQDGI